MSSMHRLLTFVKRRFKILAAGANATRKTSEGEIGSLGLTLLASSQN